jgi:hypothetical protein
LGPATKPIFTVFKEIEREDKLEYERNRMVWEGKEIVFNEQKKDYLEACKQGLLCSSVFLAILINNLIHPRNHLI